MVYCSIKLSFALLLVTLLSHGSDARGGRGGGGRGGGRARTASRGGKSFWGKSHHTKSVRFRDYGTGSRARSSHFKSAIAGAAVGHTLSDIGHQRFLVNPHLPILWNSRMYYWDDRDYPPRTAGEVCRMPASYYEDVFGSVLFSNRSQPAEIIWGCPPGEECCGLECCESDQRVFLAVILVVIFVILVTCFYLSRPT